MKADLLETSFQVSFQKELDTYTTANQKMFQRPKMSAKMVEIDKEFKESFKAKDE